jgi:membrane-bound lytic murein transglycosylase B
MRTPPAARWPARALLILAFGAGLPASHADTAPAGPALFDLTRPEIQSFLDEVTLKHGLDRNTVQALLGQGLRQPRILEAISRPAERVSPWYEYRARFLTEARIRQGAEFWQEHRERLEAVEAATGVSPAYIVAIIGVETLYGRNKGSWRVIDALMTLGFDYPPRAAFFRAELEQFLLLTREERIDPATTLGSYAGAMGAPQFIPSSYRRYAVDGSNDGQRDLFLDWNDVIASVGHYFKEHGWVRGGTVLTEATADPALMATLDPRNLALDTTAGALRARGVAFDTDFAAETRAILIPAELQDRPNVRVGFQNFHVITRYNRSIRYAMAVHELAQSVEALVNAPEA